MSKNHQSSRSWVPGALLALAMCSFALSLGIEPAAFAQADHGVKLAVIPFDARKPQPEVDRKDPRYDIYKPCLADARQVMNAAMARLTPGARRVMTQAGIKEVRAFVGVSHSIERPAKRSDAYTERLWTGIKGSEFQVFVIGTFSVVDQCNLDTAASIASRMNLELVNSSGNPLEGN